MGLIFPPTGGASQLISVIEKTASAIISASDLYSTVEFQNGANDWTYGVPLDASGDIPVGASLAVSKTGSGELLIQAAVGVTMRGPSGNTNYKLVGADGNFAFLQKTGANEWLVSGAVVGV